MVRHYEDDTVSILQILYYVLLAVLLWAMVPWMIRTIVNWRNGDRPIIVKHEYNRQRGKVLYEWYMTSWHYRIMDRALICNMRYKLATMEKEEITNEPEPMEVLPAVPGEVTQSIPPAKPVHVPHLQDEQQNIRAEYWTNASTAEINMRGYKPVERLHDTLLWWRVPQYLMLCDAYKFNVPDDAKQYPQHTPATMDNKFKSQNYWGFLKKLFAKIGPRDMDTHAIFMVLILIAGAVGGMWMLGVF